MLVSDRKEAIDGKIYDARDDIDADPVTALNIAAKLDLIDEAGRDFGFEK